DSLTLDTPAGPWQLSVLGRYADYGNPKGQLLVSGEALQQRWPDQQLTSIGILADSDAAPALAAALPGGPAAYGAPARPLVRRHEEGLLRAG
ncbi:MAG: hypothetical protein ACLFRZ_12405, partial [Rhodosalinus sp.]